MISKVVLSCGLAYCSRVPRCVLGPISAVNLRFVAFNSLRLVRFLRFRLKDKRTDSDSFVSLLVQFRFLRLSISAVLIKPHFCGLTCFKP